MVKASFSAQLAFRLPHKLSYSGVFIGWQYLNFYFIVDSAYLSTLW